MTSIVMQVIANTLVESPRGTTASLCQNTSLSLSEVSNWLSGRRPLPSHKAVEALDWLIASGFINIERVT